MSTAANSYSAPIQAQNSPRGRQLKNSSAAAARGVSEISPMSGIVDQEQFLTSSSSTASDSLPIKETVVVASGGSFAEEAEDVQLENSDNGAAKKRAWNKPSNGVSAELGAVMGAESWPALSDSARASPKSPSTYSLKPPHGSVALSQELDMVSLSSPKEDSTSISTPNSNPNHVPSRQRSMKRGGGSSHNNAPPNDSPSQTHSSVVDVLPSNQGKMGNYSGESSRDNPNKDLPQRGRVHGGGNESQAQRSSFRRSNSGPLARGDGSYHHGRRDQRDHERGKDWGNRSFGSRDQRVGSRPFFRGPSPNAPFIPPPPIAVRPFVPPVVYNEMPPVFYVPGPHPDSLRQMSMVPMFLPMHDPHLPSKIVNQIDYYFSNENLVKDTFLRRNMDAEGWVSIKLIAGFKKVMQLTDNAQLILDAIQASNVVEVQGDKVRRRSDWIRWIMPAVQSTDMLAAHLSNVTLEENAAT